MENLFTNGTFVIGLLGILFTAAKFVDNKKREQRWKEFDAYYNVVAKIQNIKEEPIGLLEQIASIYELKYFKRYYMSSVKILECAREFDNFKKNDNIIKAIDSVKNDIEKKAT